MCVKVKVELQSYESALWCVFEREREKRNSSTLLPNGIQELKLTDRYGVSIISDLSSAIEH
jgi:hypothetical protein